MENSYHPTDVQEDYLSPCELDSHANTSVAGRNFTLISEPTRMVTVHGYSPELTQVPKIPVASAATVWLHPNTAVEYLLVLHQCLYFGNCMEHSLICPNQMRSSGLIVDDTPQQFCVNSTHSIFDAIQGIRIPLLTKGVVSMFETYKTTQVQIYYLPRITLTSDDEWVHAASEVEINEMNYPPVVSMVCTTIVPDTIKCLSPPLTEEGFHTGCLHISIQLGR
jgi:hypothetical protein